MKPVTTPSPGQVKVRILPPVVGVPRSAAAPSPFSPLVHECIALLPGSPSLVSRFLAFAALGSLLGCGGAIEPMSVGAGEGAPALPQPDTALYRATFDSTWNRIQNTHFDPEGILPTWEAARVRLRPRALNAASNNELRSVLRELLAELGESHFVLIPSESFDAYGEGDEAAPVSAGLGVPGLEIRRVEGTLTVSRVRAGSKAERAGVRTGWIVEEVGETPVDSLEAWVRESARPGDEERTLDAQLPGAARYRLVGAEGDSVSLRFTDGSGMSRSMELEREAPEGEIVRFGSLPPYPVALEWSELRTDANRRVGLIRATGWFIPIVSRFAAAIDELRDSDAIVIDLRGNPGGIGGLVMGIGGHFIDESLDLGTFRNRDSSLRFVINPQRVAPDGRRVEPFDGPVAILVDPLSASTSEIFAAGMQALGRARIIGEPTPGYALPALVTSLPNGDRLMHAIADYTAPDGTRIEGRGVIPDDLAPPSRAALLAGNDRALDRALGWIDETFNSSRR